MDSEGPHDLMDYSRTRAEETALGTREQNEPQFQDTTGQARD